MRRIINKSDRYFRVVASGTAKRFAEMMFDNPESVLNSFEHEHKDGKIVFTVEESEYEEFLKELTTDYYHNRKQLSGYEEEQILYFINRVSNIKSKI